MFRWETNGSRKLFKWISAQQRNVIYMYVASQSQNSDRCSKGCLLYDRTFCSTLVLFRSSEYANRTTDIRWNASSFLTLISWKFTGRWISSFPRARVNIQYSWMHSELFMMLFEKVESKPFRNNCESPRVGSAWVSAVWRYRRRVGYVEET